MSWQVKKKTMTALVRCLYKGKPLDFLTRPAAMSDLSVIREVLTRRAYEKRGIKLSESAVWLDCGAHIGTFACAASLEGCRVYCFEPHPENYDLLLRNLDINDLSSQVECYNAALLSTTDLEARGSMIPLYLAPKSTSFHSTIQPHRSGASVTVSARSLEDFLTDHPDIDGLKLDCEGEEMPLLESVLTKNALLQPIRQIVFEWDFKRDRRTQRLRNVVSLLEQLGFAVTVPQRRVFTDEEYVWWPSGVLVYARRL